MQLACFHKSFAIFRVQNEEEISRSCKVLTHSPPVN
jgi:hypothetical protein